MTSIAPKPMWYSLLSFPTGQALGNVPHKSWHADEPIAAGHTMPWTVFAFVLLADVAARRRDRCGFRRTSLRRTPR